MKKSGIKDIFYGIRGTAETIKSTKERRNLNLAVLAAYDKLVKELAPNQQKLQDAYVEAREVAVAEQLDSVYAEGFKLGLLIGIECLEE